MNSVTACNEEDHKELVHKQEKGKWLSNSEVSLSIQHFFFLQIQSTDKEYSIYFYDQQEGKISQNVQKLMDTKISNTCLIRKGI